MFADGRHALIWDGSPNLNDSFLPEQMISYSEFS